MKKSRSITLLTILSVLLISILLFTFIRFPIGIKNYNSIFGTIKYDYDIVGGAAFTLSLEEDDEVEDVFEVIDTIKERLKILGYQDPRVEAVKNADPNVKDSDIRIEVKNSATVSQDIDAVAAYGTIEFYGGTDENPTQQIMTEENCIKNSSYMYADGTHYCVIELTDYGYNALKEAVGTTSPYYLRISLGDENNIFSGMIQEANISRTLYPSYSNQEDAKRAVLQVKTGGLAYRYKVTDEGTVSALFGENTITYSFIAVALVLVVAIIGLSVLYKGFGLISFLTLLSFILAEIGMMVAVPGIIISIGGIIGIILSTILATDGLMIIIKRVNEEFANGKTVKASVKTGFKRAFKPILNNSVICGIVSILLFALTGGTIQCFAITFGIGVVISFLTSILICPMFTNLILPLVGDKGDKFLNLKRAGE